MIILKIGGSILTEKDSARPEVDYESLERIAGEIEDALYSEEMSNDLVDGLIIVHGAGSFGHPPAKKYKIGEPFERHEYLSKKLGFAEIQNDVQKTQLNNMRIIDRTWNSMCWNASFLYLVNVQQEDIQFRP